jgi:hypothetical protein
MGRATLVPQVGGRMKVGTRWVIGTACLVAWSCSGGDLNLPAETSGEANGGDLAGDDAAAGPDDVARPEVDGEATPETGADAPLDESGAGDADAEREVDADDGGPPPPACPTLAERPEAISFLPPEPWDGGSVRVRVTGPDGLTNVAIDVTGTAPAPAPAWIGVEGSGPYAWSWSLSPLAAGDYCVVFRADPGATVYQRAPLRVADGPPPGTPVYKVVANHQWTCEEEYTWAINVDTVVLDEAGAPLPGVRVLVEHAPCDTAEDHPPPAEVTTGGDGTVRWENYNPRCFFHERVADGPSDTAIEIYTGIWETQRDESGADCNYCSTFAENVWGHWSYTITFQRLPATEVCEVPGDHAGQSRCSPLLHWEDPSGPCTTP